VAELPFISVVIPTRNRAARLEVALRGLVSQEYPSDRYEVIVVDDGSSDGTAAVAEEIAGATPVPIIVLGQSHQGASAARNTGIGVARGDPVCLVDDDVDVPPEWLAAYAAGVHRHPLADCLGGPIRLRFERPPPPCCPAHHHFLASELDMGAADRPTAKLYSANMGLRRRALETVGLFNPWLVIGGEDLEWEERLHAAGGHMVYLGDAGLWHCRSASELRLRRLVRARFARSVAFHRYLILTGRRISVRRELGRISPLLVHAWRQRCTGGLLAAATFAGYAYGMTRHRRLRPPETSTLEPGADLPA
jgi:glycosyltransferase involved in cell wall biosynthesis